MVVPVRSAEGGEYEKLVLCTRAIRRRIPVNKLIMPTSNPSSKTRRRISELADIPVFDETAKGAGLCRALGLREVETEYYASIDADTAVRQEWYSWCIRTLREAEVAACQGYSRPLSRLWDKFVRLESLDIGHYADLGNTMLRTEIVREVGMPTEAMMEDHILYEKVIRGGYRWVVNRELSSDHLLNELDVLLHRYWYGRFAPQSVLNVARYCIWLAGEPLMTRNKRYGPQLSVFLTLADISYAIGSLAGYYRAK